MTGIYDLSGFVNEEFADRTMDAREYLGRAHHFLNIDGAFPGLGNVWAAGRMLGDIEVHNGKKRFALGSWSNNRFIYCIDESGILNHVDIAQLDLKGKGIDVYGSIFRNQGKFPDIPERESCLDIGAIYTRSSDGLVQAVYHSTGVLRYDTEKILAAK